MALSIPWWYHNQCWRLRVSFHVGRFTHQILVCEVAYTKTNPYKLWNVNLEPHFNHPPKKNYITSFIFITMFCGTESIPQKNPWYFPHPVWMWEMSENILWNTFSPTCPDQTKLSIQFQLWNCFGLCLGIDVGPPLFTLLQPEMPTDGVWTGRCDQPHNEVFRASLVIPGSASASGIESGQAPSRMQMQTQVKLPLDLHHQC